MGKKKYTIVCSFDDGYKSDLKVAGLLEKYGLPGVFYVVLDWIDKDGFLTWDDIYGLFDRGFEIGSHTVTHPPDLKKLYDEEIHFEVQNSKDMLETAGFPVKSFCYPRGRADERVKRFVADAGYLEARGTGKLGIIEVKDRLYLPGTIHVFQREEYEGKLILNFAKETIDKVRQEGGYCNMFGHSKEIERDGNWEVLEEILKYVSKSKV